MSPDKSMHTPTMLAWILALVAATAAIPVQNSASYAYAVDFSMYASPSAVSCLKSSGYGVAFVRVYSPVGVGAFDNNSIPTIRNAYSAGVGTEVYMTPVPKSNKTAAQQFDETYNTLSANGITLRNLWIQVVSPANWQTNANTNKNFISSLIVKAQNKGLSVGIYTSVYDWGQITGNWTAAPVNSVWYYKVNGTGVSGESPANFNDFKPFGSFTSPVVKQFGQYESVCGLTVNRDVFSTAAKAERAAVLVSGVPVDPKKIVVGANIIY